ncbi:3-methyladenine DNA glycosylase [Helicobacter sp. 11S03491-1]|uniref:3-methyladenine DNA glycosylase n=1 Tax=Helicobacter sp. 11S03491-1 TaxID=1476196 RepID=UPI000BA5DCF0|nr:3-methyladenine DNA glycosylase [Helicobacter sp. 11S03491-1]PAF42912.1 3-methyladenine DNA glycosylase [Helicobacter sp. 11S03491-1]
MFDSYDILVALKKLGLLQNSPAWWWPNALSFEVVIGAILTQNTKWENVEKSLKSLKNYSLLNGDDEKSLNNIACIQKEILASHIGSSGFFNQKSIRLILLCQNILEDFGSFGNFVMNVDREWLLGQKGIGRESADAILNYACGREVMVIDKYTYKFLCSLGIDIQDYEQLQIWFERGIQENLQRVFDLYPKKITLAQIYSRFHGKIVEFSKKKSKLEL